MFGIGDNYEMLWKAIIRPPRAQYNPHDLGSSPLIKGQRYLEKTESKLKEHKSS